ADSQLQIAPDGRSAAFVGESETTVQILDLKSARQRRIARVDADAGSIYGYRVISVAWTADSKSIRYLAVGSEQWTVHEVNLAGQDRIIRTVKQPEMDGSSIFPSHGISSRTKDTVEVFSRSGVSFTSVDTGLTREVFR